MRRQRRQIRKLGTVRRKLGTVRRSKKQISPGIMSEIIIYSGRKDCGDGFESTSTMCEQNSSGVWECTGDNVSEGGGCPDAPGW